MSGGFTMVDFSIPAREQPMSHAAADAPLCEDCQKMRLQFFDPTCGGCQEILQNPKTSISQLFAVMRQWVPQTQRNMKTLTREVLRRGAHVNDKDGLTDLALLHYACKSAAAGVGNTTASVDLVSDLISKGADTKLKCRWTDMNVLHYASFFDCDEMIRMLVEADKDLLNATSKQFDGGTSLHIAAANLCVDAAKALVSLGADPFILDARSRSPGQCVPEDAETGQQQLVDDMKRLLTEAEEGWSKQEESATGQGAKSATLNADHITVELMSSGEAVSPGEKGGVTTLASLGLTIGDRVKIGGDSSRQFKIGVLKFFGSTEFASGLFAGVELDEPVGKHDGSFGGIRYFSCKPKCGIFAPIQKVSKAQAGDASPTFKRAGSLRRSDRTKKKDSVGELPESPLVNKKVLATDIEVGERVTVTGFGVGTIKYTGVTKFAPGIYLGVELDQPQGKNDGMVDGTRYFTCKPNHGLFVGPSKVRRLFRRSESGTPQPSSSDPSPHRPVPAGTSPMHSGSLRRDQSQLTRSHVPKSKADSPAPANELPTIKEGASIYYNSEIGVVRYIGPFDLSEGTWMGLEMKRPCGKNDGSVQGKRYFSCKPNHGVMVRPSKVTYRGINCSKLLSIDS